MEPMESEPRAAGTTRAQYAWGPAGPGDPPISRWKPVVETGMPVGYPYWLTPSDPQLAPIQGKARTNASADSHPERVSAHTRPGGLQGSLGVGEL